MTEPSEEFVPTDDDTPDGTQLPSDEPFDAEEVGDAGVNDDGTEEWYEEGDG